MNFKKSAACLIGALSLPAGSASAQDSFLLLNFRDEKTFQITGEEEFDYLGGQWFVSVEDGALVILPCAANFGEFYTPPNLTCPAGTTSLITQGDLDGDGVRETGLYLSTEQPIPATSIQPFSPNLIRLSAAPPSDLPRPVAAFNWVDQSIRVFYDIVADPLNGVGYNLAAYTSVRPYLPEELERHRDEIVPGVYQFTFPLLGSTPENPGVFVISAAHREMVEAAPGPGGRSVDSGGIFVGNDFVLRDDRWHDGVVEIDPRIGFEFEWEGFNPSTFLADDTLAFAIRDRETGLVRFPPVPFPDFNPDTRQLIGSQTLGIPSGINIGADFFAPDENLVAELEFRRALLSGNTLDSSGRFFRWDIDLIDSYDGFLLQGFPAGTPLGFRAPNFDYDGDGFTNLEEFGLQTDPIDPASVPNVTPVLEITNQCLLDIPKRPAIGNSLDYFIESSVDQETWTTIDSNDPNWFLLFDNEDRITVLSRRPAGVNPCFLRVRLENN